jgi:O-antigen ligase
MVHFRRGLAAPLSFLALLAAAYGSAHAAPSLWAIGLGLVLASAFLFETPAYASFTAAGVVVFLLAGWMALSNVLFNPSYTAAAPYHAAFLAGGFLLGQRAGEASLRKLYGAALAFAVLLAAWALWQKTHGAVRPAALFETPAMLAAVLNLVLVPGIALLLAGKARPLLVVALALIAAGVVMTSSRGGWLGLGGGAAVAGLLLRRAELVSLRHALSLLAALIAGAALLAWAASEIAQVGRAPSSAAPFSMLGPDAVRSSVARLELYELALRSMMTSSFPTGYGYLGFYYLLEAGRQGIATYENAITYFVHNDYLQALLELGIPGLVGLIFLAGWPVYAAARAARRHQDASLPLIATASAASSMAVHALVDYPFYAPVCLLIFGAALGLIAAMSRTHEREPVLPRSTSRFVARAVLLTLAAWLIGAPLAAELAGDRAHHEWRRGANPEAAYWFEVARRLESRDWRYHWETGQFWLIQALQNRNPEAARLADSAFADGVRANPRDVRNLLGRIETQRRLADILPAPIGSAEILAWSARAREIAPSNPAVRRLSKEQP